MSTESVHARLTLARAPAALCLVDGPEAELRERWKRAAHDDAFARGREQGCAETKRELGTALDRALEEIDALRDAALGRLAQDAAELAVEIARELVRCEIKAQRHDIERIVRETLAASSVGRSACVVHLHPRDAQRLEQVHFRARTQIESDVAVAEGDVHVTTPQGLLVRDLEHALDAIAERLRQELGT